MQEAAHSVGPHPEERAAHAVSRQNDVTIAPDGAGPRRRRVVVVGGGFGGPTAARELGSADVDVTLVDRTNHHLFQPLLYQVAVGALSTGQCASPIRSALKDHANTTVLMAEVTDVDAERRQVVLERSERLDYDSLIRACGAETSYFGRVEWREVTCGLKTLADAVSLRERVYGAFEQAERCAGPAEREAWMTFEIAGQLAIVARRTMERDFTHIDPSGARVILLDAGERVVPAFSPTLSGRVAAGLRALGVTLHAGARATGIDREGVTAQIGRTEERIAAHTVVWAAGVRPAGLTGTLARATGAATDHAGRIAVRPDLTVAGHPEISVIGDVAALAGGRERRFPGLATVAIQQARHVAAAIRAGAPGATTPFRYLDKGALAVVGRGRAVCEIRGLKLSGRLAFATYLGVHLYYLSGVPGRRISVLVNWIAAWFGERQNRALERGLPRPERSAPTMPVPLPEERPA